MRAVAKVCEWTVLAGFVLVALTACGGGGGGSPFTPMDITSNGASTADAQKANDPTKAIEAPFDDGDSATTADKFASSAAAASLIEEREEGKGTGGGKTKATPQPGLPAQSTTTLGVAPGGKNTEK